MVLHVVFYKHTYIPFVSTVVSLVSVPLSYETRLIQYIMQRVCC